MARFAWNSVTQSLPIGLNRAFFFNANPSRVALIVSSDLATTIRLATGGGSDGASIWIVAPTFVLNSLTYRDYGPPMQDAVYVSVVGTTPTPVTITEVYKLPGC